jgi:Gas vesicle synthesis protein GvpL/GvpF
VASEGTRLVESNGLAALVSSVPAERLRVRRSDLHAHLRALEEVFEQTTVLPCRFGTVLASEDDVRRHLLDARREELHGLLERVEGHAQLNVKAVYDEPEVLREVAAADPRIAGASGRARGLGDAAYFENIQLGELIAARLAGRRADDAERVHARLAPLASDVVVDTRDGDPLLVLKAFFLVERRRVERFDAELESLAQEEAPAIRFELVGPLPPTAFVSLGQEG